VVKKIQKRKLGNSGLEVSALSPGFKLDLVISFKVNLGSGPYWAHPGINKGVFYIRHGEALMAFNIKK
jgi:hypothetical protein